MNWARNRNKLVDLQGATYVGIAGGFGVSTAVKGYPLGTFYGTDFVRCRLDVPDADNTFQNTNINQLCRAANLPSGTLYVGANGFPIQDPGNHVIGIRIRTGPAASVRA